MDVYSLWSRRRSRRGGNRCTELKVKQEKGETNQDEQTAGLVYWDVRRNRQHEPWPHGQNGFKDIITEFVPKFEELKQLARELRSVLFPIKYGAIFTGKFRDYDIMYDGMLIAFGRAIDRLGKEEQPVA